MFVDTECNLTSAHRKKGKKFWLKIKIDTVNEWLISKKKRTHAHAHTHTQVKNKNQAGTEEKTNTLHDTEFPNTLKLPRNHTEYTKSNIQQIFVPIIVLVYAHLLCLSYQLRLLGIFSCGLSCIPLYFHQLGWRHTIASRVH